MDVGLDRPLGARLAGLGRVLAVLQPARVVDVPGRGDRRHRGRFDVRGGQTTLHVESVDADGSPRDFYSTSAVVVGPISAREVPLVQIAPGVYEAPLGEIESGAYGLRITQTRPGSTPLGRTVGLVAPTAAEYRLLGANEPFLTALADCDRRGRRS